jgi:hypothetical protein
MKKPEKQTRTLAMLAKCHDCMGEYSDGIIDCKNPTCPLYTWMPRKKTDPDLEWLNYNPKMKGKVLWEDCGRELTDEQRKNARDRLKAARERKND